MRRTHVTRRPRTLSLAAAREIDCIRRAARALMTLNPAAATQIQALADQGEAAVRETARRRREVRR